MKYLTNLYDPNKEDARHRIITSLEETREQAWEAQQEWLSDKAIGVPSATEYYTVEDLQDMGMVGIYMVQTDE